MMTTNENFGNSYTNVADFLEKEHRFVDLPDDVIFVTNQVFSVQPYVNMSVTTDVITFMDTGMVPQHFYPMYDPAVAAGYINVTNSLQVRTSSPGCQFFGTNPNLPAGSKNGNFYNGSAEFCPNNTGAWTSGPPGWTTDYNAAGKHPQFRLPSIDITNLTCSAGLSSTNAAGEYTMCGADFYAWLDAQVPPAQPRDDIHTACKAGQYRHVQADGTTTKCRLDRTWVEAQRPDRPVQWWKFASDPVASADPVEMDDLEGDYSSARQAAMENGTGERPRRGR